MAETPYRSATARAAFDPGASWPVVVTDAHQGSQFRPLECVDSTRRDTLSVVLMQVLGGIVWRKKPWWCQGVRAEHCTCAWAVQPWLLCLGIGGDYCGATTVSFDPVGVTVSTCWICFCPTPCGFFVKSIYQGRKLSLVVWQVRRKCSVVLGISEGICGRRNAR